MKNKVCLIVLAVGFLFQPAYAQMTFKEAKKLIDSKEYFKAEAAFATLQEQALAAGDTCLYMDYLFAQGEVAYMLDWTTTIKEVLEKAGKGIYARENDSIKYAWLQAYYKLEGSYYYCMTDIDKNAYSLSLDSYSKSLEYINLLKKHTRFDNPTLKIALYRDLLNLYYKYTDYESALILAEKIYDHWYNYYDEDKFMDACISKAMVLAHLGRFNEALECIDEIYDEVRDENPYIYRTKGKILIMQHDHDGSGDVEKAKKCYEKYANYIMNEIDEQAGMMSEIQREQYWLNMSQFATDCYRLGDKAPELLYDMALYSKGYILKSKEETKKYNWKNVKWKLKKNECAIEFIQYKGTNEKEHLGALVVKPDSKKPEFIEIGTLEDISGKKTQWGHTLGKCISSDKAALKDELYSDSTVFGHIWTQELLKAIVPSQKVYFSPDGIIHQLAIEYMLPNCNFECRRLSSTRILLSPPRMNRGNLLLLGGIDFYAKIDEHVHKNDIEGYMMLHGSTSYINDLPGTDSEIRAIYKIRNDGNSNDSIINGRHATDDNFLKMANDGYSIVHLATHGYFTGSMNGTHIKPAITDKALSESGIIMAGAGRNLATEDFNPELSDGILTAKEISEQDFSNVELMVLSACQTGLGYVTSDGVYGMQRALKQAGVSSMMLSLWSVDDIATRHFMENFYTELKKDNSPTPDGYKAFMNARRKMIESKCDNQYFSTATLSRKKTEVKYHKPRYTNAFILIDML